LKNLKRNNMKQETLEEAALNIIPNKSTAGWIDTFGAYERTGFIKGAKYQAERMYSKEEVFNLMCKAFEAGFKKYDVVEAGLEGLETDIECNCILKKYGKNN